jgi:subtilisin family serine protease
MNSLHRIIVRCAILLGVLSAGLDAQELAANRYWVYFHDKPSLDVSVTPAALGISERALRRRAKVVPRDRLIDAYDIPVRSEYKILLVGQGIRIAGESRWLNALSVEAAPGQVEQLRSLQVIRKIDEIGHTRHPRIDPQPVANGPTFLKPAASDGIDYGTSLTQLDNIFVPQVHKLGIIGSGMLVGMIDDGYNAHRTHNALKHIPVLKEYDWIQADSNTSTQPGEAGGQGDHGCYTMSALAGFANGQLVGPAYGVSMILAKTEFDPTETQIEMDRYVFALEWLEREGCDVVSTSLGYDDLDPAGIYNSGDIVYPMKDGRTAVTSFAASVAARKGVLFVTSMGNEGWARHDTTIRRTSGGVIIDTVWSTRPGLTGSVVTPADADSIVAVGATFSFGEIVSFSSTGPTADGRVKPEVVAQGLRVKAANPNNLSGYVFVDGTSLSTPLTAGVAALVLSAHPELTPMQVREALMNTATHPIDSDPSHTASWPNNYYGAGMVNAYEAVLYHGLVFGNRPVIQTEIVSTDTFFVISTWLKSKYSLASDSVRLFFKRVGAGSFQFRPLLQILGTDEYVVRIRKGDIDTSFVYYVAARDNSGTRRTNPYNAPDSTFRVSPTPDSILSYLPESGAKIIPTNYRLYANYPNPFNPTTSIEFDASKAEAVELTVYNILGERVRTLFRGAAVQGTRSNRFVWNGRDEYGKSVPTGIYFYRLKTPSKILSGKMVLLK